MSLAYQKLSPATARRFPIGAEILGDGVHFRVWAPNMQQVEVCLDDPTSDDPVFPMQPEKDGYFSTHVRGLGPGGLYWFRQVGQEQLIPDPASRYQVRGPHGPSQVVDPSAYRWNDEDWSGVTLEGQVLYEMHVGTFTMPGTWKAAAERLEDLADLGVTVIEMMPITDFPGRFGWGYDGVNLFAPTHLYGGPDDLRAMIDQAHQIGLGVILDVVYNHLGPDGNYLPLFSENYFSRTHRTDWGEAINFDGPQAEHVREYFLTNATYWIREFHFDGLRLDATHDMVDHSQRHILAELTDTVRRAAGDRSVILVGENEPQRAQLFHSPTAGGFGIDAVWNDDFHHSAMVRLSGRAEAYYSDYLGKPQEFISLAKRGFLYQGQWYSWQKNPRGTPVLDIAPARFVTFIQNHDQVANTAKGQRAGHGASAGRLKAMTAYWLLSPGTPMLFQGQEFAAPNPFYYFADHRPELAEKVNEGRREFMRQFPSIAQPDVQAQLPDPADPATFVRCKLLFGQEPTNEAIYQFHRDLLRLRREDPVFSAQEAGALDGAVLGEGAFVLRFFGGDQDDRLLLVNFEADLRLLPMPEPLLAPPQGKEWQLLLSTEDLKYGGHGTPPLDSEGIWLLPGQAAIVLAAAASETAPQEQQPSQNDPRGPSG